MSENQVALFGQPVTLPAYLQNNETAKALAAQIEGDLAGGRNINRISLRNSKFRFNKEGVEVGVSRAAHLDVVIIAANPHVSRTFYLKQYSDTDSAQRPDCYSKDGRAPEMDSPTPQSSLCATCPKNAKGSALNGQGKACSYRKRVVVVADGDISGDAYALDVAAMGLFGDDAPAQRMFNLRSYIEALRTNGLIVPAVVTRLSFDDESSVPKLFFTPQRPLTEPEWRQVEARIADEAVLSMLDDVDNKTEEGMPVGQIAAPVPAATAPAAFPTAAPAAPAAAPAATPARRGRKPAAQTPPAAAPAPQAAPAGGFGMAAAPAPVAAAAPAAGANGKGFTIDLDGFDA